MENKVSVIIPVFNSEKFLDDSIKSVLSQTYSNIEIIAIDDGSTDKSLEILQKFKNKIKIITQENRGLASSLKTGIKHMRGRWFKWFSPDDILYPNAIEILVDKACQLGDDCIVYSNWEIIDEKNRHLRNFSESNLNDLDKFDFNVRLLDGQQINVNTSLIPASLFQRGCVFQNLNEPVAIDYDFFLRAAILYDTRFYLIPERLLKYRIHSEQLSHKRISSSLDYLENVRKNILSQIQDSKRLSYLESLQKYKRQKPISKKTMELGLKLISKTLPENITDKILIHYLNKIRRSR